LLPIVLEAQLIPGSFEHALDVLVDTELDLSRLAKRFRNDETGAPAYDPAVMLKIVLLAYSRGVISSRRIERLCRENVLFMAISGDSAPQFSTIATFVRELGEEASAIFTRVLLTCERQVSRSIRNSPLRTIEISPPLNEGGGKWTRKLEQNWALSPPCRAATAPHRLLCPCPVWARRSWWFAKNDGKKYAG